MSAPAPPKTPPPATADDVYLIVEAAGGARAAGRKAATDNLTVIITTVERALRAGITLNLHEVARRGDVAKATLYNRLPADLVADRRRDPDPTDPDPKETA